MSFLKRADAPLFYAAAKKWPDKQEWVFVVVSCFIEDITYIRDILASEEVHLKHVRARKNMAKNYQEDLMMLLDMSEDLEAIFVRGPRGGNPHIINAVLAGDISYESAAALDCIFGWTSLAMSSDTILYPEVKKKIIKYRNFLQIPADKYTGLTKKVISKHI